MRILARIVGLALRHKWSLLGAYLFMAGATTAYLFLPKLVGGAVDEMAGYADGQSVDNSAMMTTALLILGLGALRGLLAFGQTYMGEYLGLVVVYELRNRFYDHVQHLSFGFHDRQHTGNLMSRAITDIEAMRMFVGSGLVRSPYFLVLAAIVSVLMLRLDWRLGLVGMSFMPAVAVISVAVRLRLGRLWRKIQEEMGDLSTSLQENLSGVRVVKSFAQEKAEGERFRKLSSEYLDDNMTTARIQAWMHPLVAGVNELSLMLLLLLGGYYLLGGEGSLSLG